ncbi:MAG: DUF5693 family protein [Bacillota bacterium]|nr:DUF5693 family protein [Bacillota bacterium]
MRRSWVKYVLIGVIIVAVFISLGQALKRYQVEQANNMVELAVEYGELLTYVQREGQGQLSMEGVLQSLKGHQVNGILFKEETYQELRMQNKLQVFDGRDLLATYRGLRGTGWINLLGEKGELEPYHLYLEVYDMEEWERIIYHLKLKATGLVIYQEPGEQQVGVLSLPMTGAELSQIGFGFSPSTVNEAANLGLNIYLQLRNWPTANDESIPLVFEPLHNLPNLKGVLFNDNTLPGIPKYTRNLVDELEQFNVPIVAIDLFEAQQHSLASLVRSMEQKEVIRLHTISQNEMNTMSQPRAIQRFELAVTERNNRLLLLRFINDGIKGDQWLSANLSFIERLSNRLMASGHPVGELTPYSSIPFSKINILVIAAGVMAAGALLLSKLGLRKLGILLAGAGLVATGLLLAKSGRLLGYDNVELVRKTLALGASVIFPTLAVAVTLDFFGGKSLRKAIVSLIIMTGISLLGALMVVGLLADLLYLVKLDQFTGIKLAHSLPLVLIALVVILKEKKWHKAAVGKDGLSSLLKAKVQAVNSFLKQPLLAGSTMLVIILLAAGYIYLSRTGNQSIFVTEAELQLRGYLDQLLGVRPRTKEFLIAHPIMLGTLYFGYRHRLGLGLILIGAIGQASVVNTFAHIHTPLLISIIRTGLGLGIGIAIGIFGILMIKIFVNRCKILMEQKW